MSDRMKPAASRPWLSLSLLTVAIIVLALSVGLGARTWQAWQNLSQAESVMEVNDVNESPLDKALAASKERAEALKKKNLISPPPPEENPVKSASGVIGNEVLINGKRYKVGDKIGDAEIVAIETTHVTVKWKGKESTLKYIDGGSGGGGRPSGPPRPSGRGRPAPSRPGPPPGGMSPKDMSPEQRKEMMEKMKDMPPEAQKAFMKQMRNK